MDDTIQRTVFLGAKVLGLLLLSATLSVAAPVEKKGSFSGTWSANGSKEVLALGTNRETALFKLAGHVHLKNDAIGKEKDFFAQCIGLADSASGSDIRCVWRSLEGQELYLTLRGIRMEQGGWVRGNIIGGSGTLDGITGELHFTWTSMSFTQASDETGIGGFSQDVSGSYQLP